jgi:hypothetical protein
MPSNYTTNIGDVFSVRYLDSETRLSENPIGTFEQEANGDIKVSLKKLPWGGGHLLLRPHIAPDARRHEPSPS